MKTVKYLNPTTPVHHVQLLSLQAELDSAHQSYLELKMCTEEEVQSLKHQLKAAQKVSVLDNNYLIPTFSDMRQFYFQSLGRIERDYEVMRQTMNQEVTFTS